MIITPSLLWTHGYIRLVPSECNAALAVADIIMRLSTVFYISLVIIGVVGLRFIVPD